MLDATTGQNAINQAKAFTAAIDVTGIFLAKLDGTAKGGIVVAIRNEVNLPVKFVGLGESYEDIEPFDPEQFVDADRPHKANDMHSHFKQVHERFEAGARVVAWRPAGDVCAAFPGPIRPPPPVDDRPRRRRELDPRGN